MRFLKGYVSIFMGTFYILVDRYAEIRYAQASKQASKRASKQGITAPFFRCLKLNMLIMDNRWI